MVSALATSTKNSAGPPMPNDVREASGSSALTPPRARSQSRLDFLRQLIAQLLADVARAHQQHQVVAPDEALQGQPGGFEVTDIRTARHEVGQVAGAEPGGVLLAGRVHVEDQHAIRSLEGAREVLDQRRQPRVAVRLENDDQAP